MTCPDRGQRKGPATSLAGPVNGGNGPLLEATMQLTHTADNTGPLEKNQPQTEKSVTSPARIGLFCLVCVLAVTAAAFFGFAHAPRDTDASGPERNAAVSKLVLDEAETRYVKPNVK